MNGTTFLYPLLQETAFITTHFGFRQGMVWYSVPALPMRELGKFDLNLAGLAEDFDLGVRFTNWLGAFVTAEGVVFAGGNVPSVVLSGAHYEYSVKGGAAVRLARLESSGTQFALRLMYGHSNGQDIGVLKLVQAILGNPNSSLGDVLNGNIGKYVLTPSSTSEYGGSLHAAQALSRYVSLQASTTLSKSDTKSSPFDTQSNTVVDVTSSSTEIQGDAAVALDGAPAGFPVALMVEFEVNKSWTSANGGDSTASPMEKMIAAGLYYSGRPNLQTGVAVLEQLGMEPVPSFDENGNPASSGTPTLIFGQLILRYIW